MPWKTTQANLQVWYSNEWRGSNYFDMERNIFEDATRAPLYGMEGSISWYCIIGFKSVCDQGLTASQLDGVSLSILLLRQSFRHLGSGMNYIALLASSSLIPFSHLQLLTPQKQVVYHGYYSAATELNYSSNLVKRSKISHHAEGCFDYLRQSILCHADTNIEPLVPELYGVNTAIPRVCRDIGKVIEWSERWKSAGASEEIYEVPQGIMQLEKEIYT